MLRMRSYWPHFPDSLPYFEVSRAALVNRKLIDPDASSYFALTKISGLAATCIVAKTEQEMDMSLWQD